MAASRDSNTARRLQEDRGSSNFPSPSPTTTPTPTMWREAQPQSSSSSSSSISSFLRAIVSSLLHFPVRSFIPKLQGLTSAYGMYTHNWREILPGDIAAGLVVAVMLIPQALAYALLAGMPPVTGFFAAIMSLFSYPLLGGSSSHQSVGPVALMSIMSEGAVRSVMKLQQQESSNSNTATGENDEMNRFASLSAKLAFLIGVFQVGMGLLKAGYLINFLSHPVLAGFTASSAIIIASSQLSKAFGFSISQTDYAWQTWRDVVLKIPTKTHGLSLGLFVANMFAFIVLNHYRQKLLAHPAVKRRGWLTMLLRIISVPLVLVILNTAITGLARLDTKGLKILGKIPAGMPPFHPQLVFESVGFSGSTTTTPTTPFSVEGDFSLLLPSAALIALISYVESASVAKSMETKYGVSQGGQPVDGSQELLGLGGANLVVSVFSGFPITGGFSRSGVNAEAGAKTVVAGLLSGTVLCIIVSFATGLFYYLPDVALAALIMYSAMRLLESKTIQYLAKVDAADAMVYVLTVAVTLGAGIETGLMVGAGVSLLRLVKEAAQPHTAVLGKMPDGSTYRNVKRFPGIAQPIADLAIVRIDGPVFFANTALLTERIVDAAFGKAGAGGGVLSSSTSLSRAASTIPTRPCRAVVLDMSGVSSVDSSGIHALLETIPHELALVSKRKFTEQQKNSTALPPAPPPTLLPPFPPKLFLVGCIGPVRDRLAAGEKAHEELHHQPQHANANTGKIRSLITSLAQKFRSRRNGVTTTTVSSTLKMKEQSTGTEEGGTKSHETKEVQEEEEDDDNDNDEEKDHPPGASLFHVSSSASSSPPPLHSTKDTVLAAQPKAVPIMLRQLDVSQAVECVLGLLQQQDDEQQSKTQEKVEVHEVMVSSPKRDGGSGENKNNTIEE